MESSTDGELVSIIVPAAAVNRIPVPETIATDLGRNVSLEIGQIQEAS